jgi:hypothetical protein
MKNIINLNYIKKCYICKLNGFYVETPFGGDYLTCPLCDNQYENDYEIEYCFCEKCMIIYNIGCKHAENGCTDNIYNVHFIGKYKYNDEIFIGMPQFDDKNQINDIEILEWICPNNGCICENAYYKESKYYSKCTILT